MNKLRLLLTMLVVSVCSVHSALADVEINETNFPDANFRTYLLEQSYGQDGVITDVEIASITSIYAYSEKIASLKGIEFFTALEKLGCGNNKLTALDVSKNTALTELGCDQNQLTALDVSKNTALTRLECFSNQLTTLDVSKNTALTRLECFSNQLTTLDVSKNTALTYLSCSGNQLTTLDVSKNTALTRLECSSNQLTTLDVSKNTALKALYCSNIQLTALDLSKNIALINLSCYSNQLTALDVSKNTALEELYCYSNQLTALDLSKNTALKELGCYNNQLTTLDLSQNTALRYLACDKNKLTSLDVSKNTALTSLSCSDNQLATLDLSQNTKLYSLECYSNLIKGVGMDALVESLAEPQYQGSINVLTTNETEGNVMTTTQVAAAKAKDWTPLIGEYAESYEGKDYYYWEEYEGSAPTTEGVEINETNFPDANFRTFLLSQSYGSDGVITDAEIAEIQSMYLDEKNIASLKGIEYFTALTNLSCGNNQLTALDLSKNTALINLNCSNNLLTSLNVTGCAALGYTDSYLSAGSMSCNNNKLKGEEMDAFISSLPMSPSLKELYIIYDDENEGNVMTGAQVDAARAKGWIPMTFKIEEYKITAYAYLGADVPEPELVEINETNFPDEYFRNYVSSEFDSDHDGKLSYMETSYKGRLKIEVNSKNIQSLKGIEYISGMTELSCHKNQLTTIDISKNTLLTKLNVRNNQLTALDVSKNTLLVELRCDGNPLSSIDISKNTLLTVLDATNTQLTTIDLSKNLAMEKLYVAVNQLTALDLSMNSALRILECEKNQLIAIDLSNKPKLESLYCDNNKLTALDFSEAPTLCSLRCYNNLIKGAAMDIFVNSLPQFHDEWGATEGSFDALTTKPTEGNVITTTHVAALKAKGWTPQIGIYEGTYEEKDYYTEWKEYAGSDPTAIESIESDASASKSGSDVYFDLSGRRVTAPTKGVYVKNGRKVVVK